MLRPTVLCLVAAGALLSGCNQPAVSLKPPAFQSSENTVRDWNDVAHVIAAEMAARGLVPTLPPAPAITLPPKAVFVRVQSPDSAFLNQVATALENDVLHRGGSIARTPAGATVVNLGVSVIRWGPRDKPPGLLAMTTALTAIPAIVISASVPMSTWTAADAAGASIGGLAILTDTAIALTPTMNAEAVWQATIVTDDAVVMKLQKPIYIRTPDIGLYASATELSPIASWTISPALRGRLIRYEP